MPEDELTGDDAGAADPSGDAAADPGAVLAALREGEVEVLGRMPWSSNATLLVEVHHGPSCVRAVYKPRRGERPLWDFPPGLDRREVAAYELSAWLGWDLVPETVRRDDAGLPFGPGSLQRFVPFDVGAHYFTLLEDAARHAALRAICCLDLLINSADRKGGHCLLGDDGRIWAVDNGLTFHCETKLRTVIWDFAGDPIDEPLLRGVRRLAEDAGPEALGELLDASERTALAARAEAVARAGRFPHDHTGRRHPWPLV
ncbi:MAG: SCO1664 family protein [Acidimicrobiia bacterium]